jgi:hypothetical protein
MAGFRTILLASVFISGLFAQMPRKWSFADAAVIKIDSTATYYEYTVETATDGFVIRSPRRLAISEGAHVKVAIEGKSVFITDENGRPNETFGVSQYRLPAPPASKKTASWFDPHREPTLPLNLHG